MRQELNLTLPERLFTEIRHGIIEGHYRPHQRLVENDLAKELSASRTPVRQALQRLELEGLVVASRHGWVIREHSAEDIRQIYDVRLALESFASRLATEKASDEDLERLVAAHESMRIYEEVSSIGESEPDGTSFVELHDQFHDAIVRCAANDVLRDAIRSYREHPYNRRVAHTYSAPERQRAAASHEKMLAAICGRLPDEAERLTREHLVLSRDVTLHRVGQRI
jgi:DNA-binding GntR family transcriptional regulator